MDEVVAAYLKSPPVRIAAKNCWGGIPTWL
jgi:hypothetical protein